MTHADFLKSPFPDAVEMPEIATDVPGRFYNRELSWLGFNWRVLEEASDPRIPLLERLRFLSISATNLDEFYNVRVAGLRELAHAGNTTPAADGLTPAEQLVLINENARKLLKSQQDTYEVLRSEMEANDIDILDLEELSEADRTYLADVFLTKVFPVLSPLAIDPAHPFPFIPNLGFSLALQFQRKSDKRPLQALLPIPQQIDRFVPLPAPDGKNRFLPLEALLLLHLDSMFPGYKYKGHCAFRVLRDSDLEVEEEAEDLVREFEVALKRRRRGEVVRMKISSGAPEDLRRVIMDELHVTADEVVEVDGMIGLADLKELVLDARSDLLWPSFTPRRYVRGDPAKGHAAAPPL
jgi:polyphosphate kinase